MHYKRVHVFKKELIGNRAKVLCGRTVSRSCATTVTAGITCRWCMDRLGIVRPGYRMMRGAAYGNKENFKRES